MGILLSQASSTKADCDPLVAQVLRVSSIMKDGEEDQEPQKTPPSYSLAGDRICGNLQELHRGKDTENPKQEDVSPGRVRCCAMCPLLQGRQLQQSSETKKFCKVPGYKVNIGKSVIFM